MDLELKGKRVLITGASKGIGLACASHFIEEGAKVCIVSRSKANLDTAMIHLRSLASQGTLKQGNDEHTVNSNSVPTFFRVETSVAAEILKTYQDRVV